MKRYKSDKTWRYIVTIIIFSFLGTIAQAQAVSVLPGVKGFGMETPAGRGGQILRVTNLNASGGGSLRAAIETSGPRIVIFEISGTIEDESRLTIRDPFITIAGQTAPSPGITLKGTTLTIDTHDVLIQHLRIRTGDSLEGVFPDNRDSVNIGLKNPREELYNIIIDHCSASWSIDETFAAGPGSDNTWSNCIISEPLSESLHSKIEHSKAFILGEIDRISIIGNLIAHSRDRNPLIQPGAYGVVVNNLIYNPGDFNIFMAGSSQPMELSIVGNVVIAGINTHSTAANNMPTFWSPLHAASKIYMFDNKCRAGTQRDASDWSFMRNVTGLSDSEVINAYRVLSRPIWPNGLAAIPSSQVYDSVITNAGARPGDRDAVDLRIVSSVIHGSGRIINTPNDVGGWPELEVNRITHTIPTNPNGDSDSDGYTNMEEWLHAMARVVESTIPIPLDLTIKKAQ